MEIDTTTLANNPVATNGLNENRQQLQQHNSPLNRQASLWSQK